MDPTLLTHMPATNQKAVSTTVPITFTVEGVPRPKARARRGKGGQWYTPQSTRAYEEAVGWAARDAGIRNPYQGAVRLEITLWLPDRRRRDVDNCAKSICDGLNGIAWEGDAQVAQLTVERRLDSRPPRTEISLEALTVCCGPARITTSTSTELEHTGEGMTIRT